MYVSNLCCALIFQKNLLKKYCVAVSDAVVQSSQLCLCLKHRSGPRCSSFNVQLLCWDVPARCADTLGKNVSEVMIITFLVPSLAA